MPPRRACATARCDANLKIGLVFLATAAAIHRCFVFIRTCIGTWVKRGRTRAQIQGFASTRSTDFARRAGIAARATMHHVPAQGNLAAVCGKAVAVGKTRVAGSEHTNVRFTSGSRTIGKYICITNVAAGTAMGSV